MIARLARWFRRSRPTAGGPVGPTSRSRPVGSVPLEVHVDTARLEGVLRAAASAPSPAEVAPRVRPQTDLAPEKPALPPVFDGDTGRVPEVDPMLWSVIRPLDMPRRRPYAPEGDPR